MQHAACSASVRIRENPKKKRASKKFLYSPLLCHFHRLLIPYSFFTFVGAGEGWMKNLVKTNTFNEGQKDPLRERSAPESRNGILQSPCSQKARYQVRGSTNLVHTTACNLLGASIRHLNYRQKTGRPAL